MTKATSCGGVVIFKGKILILYKNYKNRYDGWMLPKGTVEMGEEYKETALREVKEETSADASIIKYVDYYYKLGKGGYQEYLSGHQKEWQEDLRCLAELYNRNGFTQGYLKGLSGDITSMVPKLVAEKLQDVC